jgi:RNA polymerase sigma-70 factor (ECF subfamily)
LTSPIEATTLCPDVDVAFEQLYTAAFPKVFAFIRCQVATIEIAQELVGRVFLKAYQHRTRIPQVGSVSMQWLFRIAHTTLIDYWRVDRRRDAVNLPLDEIPEIAGDTEDPEAAYERKQRSVQLVRIMNDLSIEDRTVLAFKFAAQRTNREIARILNISEGAVSMRLLRALKRVRAQLDELGWT